MIKRLTLTCTLLTALFILPGQTRAEFTFYRFDQWGTPGWWQPSPGTGPGVYYYWYQPGYPLSSATPPYQAQAPLQGPFFWYWYQPYPWYYQGW